MQSGPIHEFMALQSTADGSQSNNAPPPFLTKTYDMVDDPATDPIVSWSSHNTSFVVWNHSEFARDLLPKYFKHNNFSSFVRQLNTYGFRKVDPDRWEFANEGFVRGQRHLLKNIHRRKPSSSHGHSQQQQQQTQGSTLGCVEVGKFGLDGEIERLKRDKNVLMIELVRLRQQQQATERELQTLGSRLQAMEQRQQQMMAFLAKAMQNPGFLAQIVQQNENNIRLAAANKKRRLPKEEEETGPEESNVSEGQIVKFQAGSNDATRSMFTQLLNSDMASKVDVPASSLESLLRELAHFPAEQLDEGNSGSRSSGVTLTEMNPSALFPDPLVNDISGHSDLELPDSPMCFSETEQAGDIGSSDLEVSECLERNVDTLEAREVKAEPTVSDLNLSDGAKFSSDNEISTNGDGGSVVSNINDGFWEQFLTESPTGSTDTDAEVGTEILENGAHVQECSLGGHWWRSKAHVDQLAKQMGQLVSGSKS